MTTKKFALQQLKVKTKKRIILHRIIREIRNIFEHEDKYYKPVRAGYFCCNSYIDYKSKGGRKVVPVEEYLNKIKIYLKHIIYDLMISKNLTRTKFD